MIPQSSRPSRLTRRGRFSDRWSASLADPDPYRRVRSLLHLSAQFAKHPKPLATLWPPYLDSVLRGPHASMVTQAEFATLEAVGATVASRSKGALSLAQAWFPLLVALDARREHGVVTAMLSRLYWSPDLEPPGKTMVARKLSLRGAAGDEHLAVYADYLGSGVPPETEPVMTGLLRSCLAVGFDTPPAQLNRAGNLAHKLRRSGVAIPGVDLALGYAHLLTGRDPQGAVFYLTAARVADRADPNALLGLLTALVRSGEYKRVATVAGGAGDSSAVATGLVELSATLHWLEDPALPGQAPSTAARLAALPITRHAGEWLDYAIGRLHLLEGATQRAATALVAAADRRPERPEWHYHAAWALYLLGEWHGVAHRFALTDGWPERWTIGLLLIDANPAIVQVVTSQLTDQEFAADHQRVVAARMAMLKPHRSHGVMPVGLADNPLDSLAVRLETLRTNLGVQVTRQDTAGLAAAAAHPMFRRLPLADQLLWSGLSYLPDDLGRALLNQAAEGLAYARAGLVLAVHELRHDRVPDPALLAGLSWRDDTTVELVQAWSKLASGDVEDATARLAKLVAQDDPRVHYTLGNAWLLKTTTDPDALTHAATSFAAALERDVDGIVPDGAQLLMLCATLAVDPNAPVDCLDQYRTTTGDTGAPWTTWTIALTALGDEPAEVPLESYEQLVTLFEKAEAPVDKAAPAVAAGLARASMAASHAEHADVFLALLDRIALATPDDAVTRLRELTAANALRRGRTTIAGKQGGVLPALALAERSLTDQLPVAAAVHLGDVLDDGDAAARFCHVTADFLRGVPLELDYPPEDDSPAGTATWLLVAVAAAADDPDTGLDDLLTILRTHDLSGVVDLRPALAALCARVGRSRQAPAHLETLVRSAATTTDDVAILAHCASAVGARDTALTLWRRAYIADTANWTHYAAALRHEAAVARRAGEDRRAVDCLLLAAHVTVVREPTLLPDEDGELPMVWILDDAMAITGSTATLATHALLELCVTRLLIHLFPDNDPYRELSGRLRVLEQVVAGSRTLRRSLLEQLKRKTGRAWWNMAVAHTTDIRFHHALAVIYREHALGNNETSEHAARDLTIATTLWSLLLSAESFWSAIGGRIAADEARLRETIGRELFAAHASRGRRALAAGDSDIAAVHLRVLVDLGKDPAELASTLHDLGVPVQHDTDADRFAEVSALASEALSDWVDDVLRTATAAVTNPDAIAHLPNGVSQNYSGGVEQLEPFVRLGVPVPKVLRTGLDWYNEWSYAEYLREDRRRLARLTKSAKELADALAPLCHQGQGLNPENQALSRHMMYRGFIADHHHVAINHYQAALDWNPGNNNAQQLLVQRKKIETSDKIKEAIDRKAWTRAEKILREELARAAAAERAEVAAELALVLNAHANELIEDATKRSGLATALKEILTEVDRELGLPGLSWSGGHSPPKDCAACAGPRAVRRAHVVNAVVREVRSIGVMRETLVSFWRKFEPRLCDTCRAKLRAISKARRAATALLTEALRLDGDNPVIRENLENLEEGEQDR